MRSNNLLLLTPTFIDLLIASLEDALKNYFTPLESTSDARAEFYNKFKREAEDYDKEFSDKYGGDLDTTLVFVSLPPFSYPHWSLC